MPNEDAAHPINAYIAETKGQCLDNCVHLEFLQGRQGGFGG